MDEALRAQHDELLANIPDGVEHDTANCPLCQPGVPVADKTENSNGGDMSKTYTEEELAAAIADAVSPLQTELDTAKASKTEQEIAAKIADAIAPLEAEKADLQTALDAALVEAQAALAEAEEERNEYASLVAYLESVLADEAEEAAYTAKKTERLAQVEEVASFSDDHKAANADRWAKMSDEDFDAQISDWKEIASATKTPAKTEEKKIPAVTAMVASRSSEGTDKFANMRQIMRAGVAGNDPRTL